MDLPDPSPDLPSLSVVQQPHRRRLLLIVGGIAGLAGLTVGGLLVARTITAQPVTPPDAPMAMTGEPAAIDDWYGRVRDRVDAFVAANPAGAWEFTETRGSSRTVTRLNSDGSKIRVTTETPASGAEAITEVQVCGPPTSLLGGATLLCSIARAPEGGGAVSGYWDGSSQPFGGRNDYSLIPTLMVTSKLMGNANAVSKRADAIHPPGTFIDKSDPAQTQFNGYFSDQDTESASTTGFSLRFLSDGSTEVASTIAIFPADDLAPMTVDYGTVSMRAAEPIEIPALPEMRSAVTDEQVIGLADAVR